MSIDANEELVRKHLDLLWNQADLDGLAEIWSPEAVVRVSGLSRSTPVEMTRSGLES